MGGDESVHRSGPFVRSEVHFPDSAQQCTVFRYGPQFDADGAAGRKPEARFCDEFLDVRLPEVAAGEGDGVDNAGLAFKLEPDRCCKTVFAQAREYAGSVPISGLGADQLPCLAEPRQLCRVALTEISNVQRHNRNVMERFGRGGPVV